MSDALVAALDAFETSRDPMVRLHAALAAWRACRSPHLGELIDRVALLVSSHDHPRADAAMAAHTPTLVDAVLARIRRARRTPFCVRQIERLIAGPPDPRYADWALDQFEAPPLITRPTAPFWEAVLRLFVHGRDARHDQRLATLHTRLGEPLRPALVAHLRPLVERIGPAPTITLAPPLQARVVEGVRRYVPPARVRLGRQLLADVHGDPTDPGRRAVYADFLMRHEAPRGTFIALQLNRGAGPASARERALLDAHWWRWVEPLDRVFERDDLVFRDGFLDAVHLRPSTWDWRTRRTRLNALRAHLTAPVWQTVQTVEVSDGLPYDDLLWTLAFGPLRARLRHWRGTCPASIVLDWAGGHPMALETLDMGPRAMGRVETLPAPSRAALRAMPGMPALRALRFGARHHTLDTERWFMRTPAARRLTALHLTVPAATLPHFLRYLGLGRLRRFTVGEEAGVFTVVRRADAWDALEVRAAAGGPALAGLADLPPTQLRAVHVLTPLTPEQRAALRDALAHQIHLTEWIDAPGPPD